MRRKVAFPIDELNHKGDQFEICRPGDIEITIVYKRTDNTKLKNIQVEVSYEIEEYESV